MLKDLKKKTEGFTIIEVMIVLVIAAVIILIVFLAVPALQRNSRNNQRKNDASRVLTAVDEWRSNNNNKLPGPGASDQNTNGTPDKNEILELAGTLGQYEQDIYIVNKQGTTVANLDGNTWADPTKVNVVRNAKCETSSSKANGNGAIAVYATETGNGGTEWNCI